jgi:hypothetical protein
VSASTSPVTADVHLWICMNPECRNYLGYFGSSAEHGKDLREEYYTTSMGLPLPTNRAQCPDCKVERTWIRTKVVLPE